jgi:flagellar hook-associated protein 1
MSLNSALQIGRSAMFTSQAGIQIAGDNMANAATRGFNRRTMHLVPAQGSMIGNGQFIGQGVNLLSIRREVDVAMLSRHRQALSDEHSAMIDRHFLSTVESMMGELSGNDVSSLLSTFFNGFSELANNPLDAGVRSVVIQQGKTLANRLATMRADYVKLGDQINQSIDANITKANDLLGQIAMLNEQISTSESGQGQESALRDQRDLLLDDLAELMDITVVEQPNGAANVLVNSVPVVIGSESRGIELKTTNSDNGVKLSIRVKADGTNIKVKSGAIGGLLEQRDKTVKPMIEKLDHFASQLIFQVNKLHSQGQGKKGFTSATGTYGVQDTTAAMNSTAAGLPFEIKNGSFFIHVTHKESGVKTAHEIPVNGNSMSLEDLVAQINEAVGVPNVTAGIGAGNKLTLSAESGYEFSFSDDTSGALAVLGINTFFTGSNAGDIDVNQVLVDDPSLLAAGDGHVDGSNGTALAIANLQNSDIDGLGGKSLSDYWKGVVTDLAARTSAANGRGESTRLVRESLGAQIQSVSGVSIDEESINMMTFQRQFQAIARYIATIDQTLQTLISMA